MPASKRIVITGVSRGLGRALVEGFIARGHAVFGCARSAEAIAELRRRYPPPHGFAVVDVCRDDEVRAWAAEVLTGGPPDLLVNNAATINRNAPLWEVPAKEFSQVIDVNIKGVVNVIRHFLPAMIERGNGVVVNFSSWWGRSGAAEVAPYCATKWAIEGLTRALAAELPRARKPRFYAAKAAGADERTTDIAPEARLCDRNVTGAQCECPAKCLPGTCIPHRQRESAV